MQELRLLVAAGVILGLVGATGQSAAEPVPMVTAHASPVKHEPATHECESGHKVEKRHVRLDSGAVRYAFQYSGCVDPSHGDRRPSAEGNFGMPEPIVGNWYWGGFLRVLINEVDATNCPVEDWRVIESGKRGAFQVVFAHPDAEVCLRLMMLPGGNHVLAALRWSPRPQATVETVAVSLRCYPSFFTAARGRDGERHCQTPRTDAPQGQTLQIVPGADTYLHYYDVVFDVAKGEGDGPCAALVAPEGLTGGQVSVGGYAVMTTLDYRPEAGEARLAFYDFTGQTNADAESYLRAHGAEDLAGLVGADFRPLSVQTLNTEALRAEATRLLTAAGEDAGLFQKQVDELLAKAAALKAEADAGSWRAEAELGSEIEASADLFWRLRAFAVLNNPGP